MENKFNTDLYEIQNVFAPGKNVEVGSGNFKFSYANLNSILTELQGLKTKYTLMIKSMKLIDRRDVIDSSGNKKVEVTLNYEWEFRIGGEIHIIESVGIGTNTTGDKAIGVATSYSRRYVLLSIFNANDGGKDDTEQVNSEDTPITGFIPLEVATTRPPVEAYTTSKDDQEALFTNATKEVEDAGGN